jgi:hypothetical protein
MRPGDESSSFSIDLAQGLGNLQKMTWVDAANRLSPMDIT